MNVRNPVVEADELVRIAAFHPLVAQEPHPSRQFRIRGRHHSAFPRGHVLRRVEAECAEGTEGADGLPIEGGSMSLGGVLEDHEAVPLRDPSDVLHRGRVSIEVDRHDRRRSLSDGRFDAGRVEAEGVFVNVGEDGGRAAQGDRVRGRGEGEGGDNDLIAGADSGGEQPQVQGGGSRVHGDG